MSGLENALIAQILAEHGARADAHLFRNRTSIVWVGRKIGTGESGAILLAPGARPIQARLTEGASELIAIGPGGLFTAIEVKAGTTREQDHRDRFIQMVRRLGGLAGFAPSVKEATEMLERGPRERPPWPSSFKATTGSASDSTPRSGCTTFDTPRPHSSSGPGSIRRW